VSDEMAREPWLATCLRVVVHAITAGVIAWPLTVTEGVLAATFGGAAGALTARFVARTALRVPAVLLIGLGGAIGVFLLNLFAVDLGLVPDSLGPASALIVGDAIAFGGGAFVLSATVRTVSVRYPAWSILEAAAVAGGFAALLVGHRNGAIHRPYALGDFMIAQGEDPTIGLLFIGAIGAGVIVLLFLSERSLRRSLFHLAVVAALLGSILYTTSVSELPTPPSSGGALGLQDDEGDERREGGQGGGGGQGDRRTSDELEFRDQYPSGGGAPDAVVIFHDDYSPPGGYYYFRQNAFSQYNGRKLVAATLAGIDEDVHNVFPSGGARDVAWAPGAGMDRTSVETSVAMLAENTAPLGLEAPERFVPATNPNPQRFRRVYRVHSVSLTQELIGLLDRPSGDPAWDEDTRAHYLRGPDDPRYAELAQRILATLPPHLADQPVARALAITQWLGEHGTYSLQSRHADAEDPTASFLFGDLTGYCVHFAHAAVYLMRAAGLTARVGTGYALPEANRQGGSALLLRNSDQHAWPEVYFARNTSEDTSRTPEEIAIRALADAWDAGTLADLDWGVRADAMAEVLRNAETELATPVRSRDAYLTAVTEPRLALEGLSERSGKTVQVLLDRAIARVRRQSGAPERETEAVDAGWVVMDVSPQTVLDGEGEPPDPQLQRLLGEMARGSQPIDEEVQPPRPMRELARAIGRPAAWGALGLLIAILLLSYAIKIARRFGRSPARVYRAALDRLAEAGLRRRWGESPEAFSRRLAAQLPSLPRLTDKHLAAAFGGRPRGDVAARMIEDARVCRVELGRAVPWWRRLLGLINPFSWMLTR